MHLIRVRGPSTLLFTSAVLAAGEMNKRYNLIQRQRWHTEVRAALLCACVNIKQSSLNESLISVA